MELGVIELEKAREHHAQRLGETGKLQWNSGYIADASRVKIITGYALRIQGYKMALQRASKMILEKRESNEYHAPAIAGSCERT